MFVIKLLLTSVSVTNRFLSNSSCIAREAVLSQTINTLSSLETRSDIEYKTHNIVF